MLFEEGGKRSVVKPCLAMRSSVTSLLVGKVSDGSELRGTAADVQEELGPNLSDCAVEGVTKMGGERDGRKGRKGDGKEESSSGGVKSQERLAYCTPQ